MYEEIGYGGSSVMKYKVQKYLLLLGIAGILTACGTTGNGVNGLEFEKETMSTESKEFLIDSYEEESLDLTKYSLEYQFATDDQPYFHWHYVAKSEYGYYYFKNEMLMFFDKKSGMEVPLCNKADCSHTYNSDECNAHISSSTGMEKDNISTNYLHYYDGNLYMMGYDNEQYTCLYKISADGSIRERYMRLYKSDMFSSDGNSTTIHVNTPEWTIHRGYVYYIYRYESEQKIRRMKLGGTENEIVFASSGYRPTVYRMRAYGDYLFFQSGNYTDETCEYVSGGIYAYNTQTGESQLVKKDAISTFVIEGTTLFYNANGNTEFRSYDLQSGQDKLVLSGLENVNMAVGEQYIYRFSNENGFLNVYDHSGNLVCGVKNAIDNYSFCYGDGEYLFGEMYDFAAEEAATCVLKVADFADGIAEWTIVK